MDERAQGTGGEPINVELGGVSQTLLIPLAARATANGQFHPTFRDPHAARLLERLRWDKSALPQDLGSMAGAIYRTARYDDIARALLATAPDLVIVTLGAGLCTRFLRLDNGTLESIDVDLPDVIGLKQELLPSRPRWHYLPCSATTDEWVSPVRAIAAGRKVLFVIEGLLMYLGPDDVRALFCRIADEFAGAEIAFDFIHELFSQIATEYPQLLGLASHLRWGKVAQHLRWGAGAASDVAQLHPRLRVRGEWSLADEVGSHHLLFAILRWIPIANRAYMLAHLDVTP